MAQYKFIKTYSTTIVVGGAIGLRTISFKIGDVVEGSPKDNGIVIRVAPHTIMNEGPPSPNQYQEFIAVPSEYLQIVTGSTTQIVVSAILGVALIMVLIKILK